MQNVFVFFGMSSQVQVTQEKGSQLTADGFWL
jgi:hypothetical protein